MRADEPRVFLTGGVSVSLLLAGLPLLLVLGTETETVQVAAATVTFLGLLVIASLKLDLSNSVGSGRPLGMHASCTKPDLYPQRVLTESVHKNIGLSQRRHIPTAS